MEVFLKRKSKSATMLGKFIFSKESDAAGLRSYRSSSSPIDKVCFYLLHFTQYSRLEVFPMKQKWLMTGTALMLAAVLAGCGNTPAADQTAKISMEQAQEASYRDKNAAPVDSTQTDATTPAQTAPSTSTGAVDEAKAQEIALAHAGIKAADATITKSKLDYDDGRQIYEIEWYANGAKYDYEIAVATGEIVNSGYEAKTVVGTGSSATVSEATAKQTALARVSGATEKDIYEWKLDYDDGRPEYEGKIIYGGTEYEFTIDATSGTVTEWEAETLNR